MSEFNTDSIFTSYAELVWYRMSEARSGANDFYLRTVPYFRNPRLTPQHMSWDIPRPCRNFPHLCAKISTFQYVHFHAVVTVLFLDVVPESLQVLVAKMHRCGDSLVKSVRQRESRPRADRRYKFRLHVRYYELQPEAVL